MKTRICIAVTLLLFLLVPQACDKDSSESDPENPAVITNFTDGEGEIGPKGGTIKLIDGNSPLNGTGIYIPEGALDRNVFISISQAGNSEILYPGNKNAIIVTFEPSGLEFNKPVTIGLPYDIKGSDVSGLCVYYLDDDMPVISELPVDSIDENKKIIYATTEHFSKFSAGERNAYMNIEMINVNGKIGVKLNVFSKTDSNGESGLDGIITNSYWQNYSLYNGKDIIFWNSTNEVFSDFVVKLYAKKNGPWSNYLERKYFTVRRGYSSGGKKGIRIYDNKNLSDPLFENDDIKDDKKYEQYFQGYPLVFVFDYNAGGDTDEDYYVRVEWSLAGEPDAYIGPRYTPVLIFNTYDSPVLFNNMASYTNDDNENGIDDDYEIAENDGTFTDPRDGQIYKIVRIGDRTWFAQNLNYTPDYNEHKYFYYDGNISYCDKYGKLYNWPSANSLCPEGWHLPSQDEWESMFSYLGSPNVFNEVTGFCKTDIWKMLKSSSGWPHNGNNSSGFSALPGGLYYANVFVGLNTTSCWWSSTKDPKGVIENMYVYSMDDSTTDLWEGIIRASFPSSNGNYGIAVRCIKDE